MKNIRPIIITTGEPAGIGPDLVILEAQKGLPAATVVIADPELLIHRAERLKLPVHIQTYARANINKAHRPGDITVLPLKAKNTNCCGTPELANVGYVLESIKKAALGCLAGDFAAMVTGPVNKAIINKAGVIFQGHTEYLAELCQTQHVVMMLAASEFRVALVTTHLPLNEVSKSITPKLLAKTIEIVTSDLQSRWQIPKPRLLVSGLNPHAGESGYLGREEIDVIIPVIKEFQARGYDIQGPYPADTIVTPKYLQNCDVIISMYHDQGLPVLKYAGFGRAVNITLGLPIIRTSVDHGTAFDIAGTGKAESDSFRLAIDTAFALSGKNQHE